MRSTLPHPLLSRLSDLLAVQMGLYYPEKRWGDLERGIAAAAPALSLGNVEACAHQLLSATLTRRQIETLARHLTVGETYFFREKRSLDVLEEHILPKLIRACARANRKLRIWSAGCCTGEEPYSIAMLLDRLALHGGEWNATIQATDINPVFLQKAAEGIYGEWSFRGTPLWARERYFKRKRNGQFEIVPHIRKRVTFSYLNLAENIYPSVINDTQAMDVIFCRNVLMYFSPEGIKKIGENFHRSLLNGGWLIVSPVEVSNNSFPRFKAVPFPGVVLYQKADRIERTENLEWQTDGGGCLAPIPDSLPDRLFIPTAALAQVSGLQNGEPPFSLENIQTEALSRVPGMAAQLISALHSESRPASHEAHDALYLAAHSYANLGQLAEAIQWCEKAITANKLNPAAHYLLATIHQELGQSEIAMQSLMRTLYLEPDFVLAHFALGKLCLSQERRGEAERHFGNALSLLFPHPHDALLPGSDGLTAGRLTEIIASVRSGLPRPAQEYKERQ